jgi:hypothetical protein
MSELGIVYPGEWGKYVPGDGIENGLRAVAGRGLGAGE